MSSVWDVPTPTTTQEIPDPPEHTYGHDDGEPLTEAQLDDLINREAIGGSIVRAGEDLLLAHPDRAREVTRAVASGLTARLQQVARQAAEHRGTVGRPSASHLVHEAQVLSRAHEVLADLERTFAGLKREAAALAGEAVADHLGRKRAAVATPDGGEVVIETKAPASKVSVDEAALLDLLGTVTILRQFAEDGGVDVRHAVGVRAGIAALRSLGTPSWKSTALDALVKDLQRAGEPDLAARLEQSYARVASGEERTTLTIKYAE